MLRVREWVSGSGGVLFTPGFIKPPLQDTLTFSNPYHTVQPRATRILVPCVGPETNAHLATHSQICRTNWAAERAAHPQVDCLLRLVPSTL